MCLLARTLLVIARLTSFLPSFPSVVPKQHGSGTPPLLPLSLPIRRTVLLIVRPRPLSSLPFLPSCPPHRARGRTCVVSVHVYCDTGRREGEQRRLLIHYEWENRMGRRPFRIRAFLFPSTSPASAASLPRLPPRLRLSPCPWASINSTVVDGLKTNFFWPDIVGW